MYGYGYEYCTRDKPKRAEQAGEPAPEDGAVRRPRSGTTHKEI